MYHSVAQANDPASPLCLSARQFEKQMLYLKQRRLSGVSMRDLYQASEAGQTKGLIGLTFDDGYEDFLSTALPILKNLGFSATVFVVAGRLGEENDWEHRGGSRPKLKLLGAEGIREVVRQGMEVGSHTVSHPRLSGLETEALDREVGSSRVIISDITGSPVDGFCYPYGDLDSDAVLAARRAGYLYGCATKKRVERNLYDWPRTFVGEKDSPLRLRLKLSTFYRPYSQVIRRLKRSA
jgi:peptidoglycan/xylan/chitin deacetylase (PgdA/CDA1 family)